MARGESRRPPWSIPTSKLAERIAFVHERLGTAAIAEQYIEGRELYVGVVGNNRLRVLPVWELKFGTMGGTRQFATEKVKHDTDYQEKVGIVDGPARNLAPELRARIQRMAKRIYRTLGLDGYARIDFRLAADGTPYFIEANPNPEIAKSQEFATAAKHDGLDYPALLNRILTLWNQPGKGRRIRGMKHGRLPRAPAVSHDACESPRGCTAPVPS